LKQLLGSLILSRQKSGSSGKGESGQTSTSNVPISEEDLRDLKFILEISGEKGKADLKLLFAWLWNKSVRRAGRALKRQVFRYRA
jgi:hypothetical protein